MAENQNQVVMEVTDLRKTYKTRKSLWSRERIVVKALDGISFAVKQGEIFGLLGPNGAGKTTTINIVSGLIYQDSGGVRIFGRDALQNRERILERMNIAAAYTSMQSRLTVYQNLKVFARLYGVQNASQKISELMEFFELNEIGDKRMWNLSTGQKARANLCKALVNDPELLLLDEVTMGLDPEIAESTRELIKDLPGKIGTTILLASNNMFDIEKLCDRVAFIHQGKILRIGTPAKLKNLVGKKSLEEAFIKLMEEARA